MSIVAAAQEERARQSVAVETTGTSGQYSEVLGTERELAPRPTDHPKTEGWTPNQDSEPVLAVGTL